MLANKKINKNNICYKKLSTFITINYMRIWLIQYGLNK